MTRPLRHRFRSPELSPTSSASQTPKYNHHRKTHKKLRRPPPYEPDPSDEESEEEDEEEELTSVTNPDDQFAHSLPPNSSPDLPKPITQTDSYVNVATFPIFKGNPGECPYAHLSRFSKVCRANNVSTIETMMKIFPVTLEEEASLWYDLNVEPYPFLTWEEIKSLFFEAYRVPDYDKHLRFELMNLSQAQGESVRSYFLRLQWILSQWPEHGIPDPLVKGIFIDGLRRDFKDWVVPQKPGSLGDALRLAFTWEQVRVIRSRDGEWDAAKCGFCDAGGHEESECEVRGRMREWWIRREKEKVEIGSGSGGEEKEELASMGDSRRERKAMEEEEQEEEEVMDYSQKKSGCKCSKHQCGKKKLERNKSAVTNSSNLD